LASDVSEEEQAFMAEQERLLHMEEPNPYRIWDMLLLVCITVAGIEIPAQLVLGYTNHPVVMYFDQLLTFFFLADIIVSVRRPVTIVGKMFPSSRDATRHYLTHWFALDLLAAIPFALVSTYLPLQLLRLLKLMRIVQQLRRWRQRVMQNIHLLRLISFVFWLGLIAHWLACGWLALRGMPTDMDNWSAYLRALYWCITTLTTVGYGDITPTSNAQTVYAMVVMILGVGVYGYVIGNAASLLANLDRARALYLANMERLATFLTYRNVPPQLQRRIYEYYNYLWENRLGYDESAILEELPSTLRTEVSLALNQGFIQKVPFFKGASQELVRDIALELCPVIFTPGDYVFRAGEVGHQMYFIGHGTVEVLSADGRTIYATLTDGDFFGEIALLFSQPRTASVRALDYCDLYALSKDTFERVLAHYPDFARHIQHIAKQRQAQHQ
jgi:voltage-gated potassium channel